MRVPVDPEAGRFSADEEADKSLPSLTTALQKETCGRQKKSTFEADIVHLEAQEQWSGKQCGKAITGPRCMLMAKKRGSAQLVSGRENLCIEGMKQAGWRMKESGTLNGEGPFRAPPRSIREWLLPYKATDNGGTWFNIAICGTDFKYEKTRADPNTNNWENGNAEMGEKQTRRSGIRVLVELRRTSRETKIFAQWHQDVLVIGEAVQLRKPSGIYQQWWMNEEMKKETVRNESTIYTHGKNKQTPQGSARTTSAVDLEEFCEKHYEKLLPIMADKYEYEQRKKEKLEEVKARLDFSEARKKTTRAQLRRERSRSPRYEYKDKARREGTVFKRLGSRGRSTSVYSDNRQESSRYTKGHSESEDSEEGHWKSKSRRKKSSVKDDDLSQPW
ncbi:hypothetical protein Tco_0518960, partial [Tanacetum coccineum]